jgi:hypothetical protein
VNRFIANDERIKSAVLVSLPRLDQYIGSQKPE